MKNRFFTFHFSLFTLLLVLTLASCRSTKGGTKGKNDPTQPTTTVTTPSTGKKTSKDKGASKKPDKQDPDLSKMQIPVGTNFTSKVKVTLLQDGKDITTTGTLRMRYGEVIQLTLVDPVLGIAEVGRMELSPDNILIIDRLNKRYVSTNYEEFTALKSKDIGFDTIQEFFWKEAQNGDQFSYTIPAKKSLKIDLKLSGKGSASNWSPHTTVSDKYTKTDANQIFGAILGQ